MMQLLLENDQNPVFLPLSILSYFRVLANMISGCDFSSSPKSLEGEDETLIITLNCSHRRDVIEWIIDAVAILHVVGDKIHYLEDLVKHIKNISYRELFLPNHRPLDMGSITELTVGAKLYVIESLAYLEIPELMKLVTDSLYRQLFSLPKVKMDILLKNLMKWREEKGLMLEETAVEEIVNFTKVYRIQRGMQEFYRLALRPEFCPALVPIGKYRKRMHKVNNKIYILTPNGLYHAYLSSKSYGKTGMERYVELLGEPLLFDVVANYLLCITEFGLYSNRGDSPYWTRVKLPQDCIGEILSITSSRFATHQFIRILRTAIMTTEGIYIFNVNVDEFSGLCFILNSVIPLNGAHPIYMKFMDGNDRYDDDSLIIVMREEIWVVEYKDDTYTSIMKYDTVMKYSKEIPLEEGKRENLMVVDRDNGLVIYEKSTENFNGRLNDLSIEKRGEIHLEPTMSGFKIVSQYVQPLYTLLWTTSGLLLKGTIKPTTEPVGQNAFYEGALLRDEYYNSSYTEIGGYEGEIISIVSLQATIILYTTGGVFMAGKDVFSSSYWTNCYPEFRKIMTKDLLYFGGSGESRHVSENTFVNVSTYTGEGGIQ